MPETMGLTKYMSKMENMYTKWKTRAIARKRNRGEPAMVAVCAMRLARFGDGGLVGMYSGGEG